MFLFIYLSTFVINCFSISDEVWFCYFRPLMVHSPFLSTFAMSFGYLFFAEFRQATDIVKGWQPEEILTNLSYIYSQITNGFTAILVWYKVHWALWHGIEYSFSLNYVPLLKSQNVWNRARVSRNVPTPSTWSTVRNLLISKLPLKGIFLKRIYRILSK